MTVHGRPTTPAFSRCSPGLLLHVAMSEVGAADGIEYVDLGRGPKDYRLFRKWSAAEGVTGPVTGAVSLR